jgi:hypothetical protein
LIRVEIPESFEVLRGALVRHAELLPLALLVLVMVLAGLAFNVPSQPPPCSPRPGSASR